MGRPFDYDDVVGGRAPSWRELIARGLLRRCGRCGGDDVFATRWQLAERCPDCGYRFVREPGFRLGAWFLNYMLLQFILFGLAFGFILWSATHSDVDLRPALAVGGVICIVVPIAFYPTSQTLWAAIDLGMTPLELDEIVDAVDAVPDVDPDGGSGDQSPQEPDRSDVDSPDERPGNHPE